jgi:hypothetical protein
MPLRWLLIWSSVCALLIAGWAVPTSAGPLLTANSGVGTGVPIFCIIDDPIGQIGKTLADCGLTGNQQIAVPSIAGPVKADATLSNAKPSDLWTFGGEAHATASYGILGASAKDSSTCTMFNSILCGGAAGFSAMGFAFGTATFTDTLTYSPPPPEIVGCPVPHCPNPALGDGGTFIPTFTIHGSATGTHHAPPPAAPNVPDARGFADLSFGPACVPSPNNPPFGVFCTPASGHVFFGNFGPSVITVAPFYVPFTYGVPMDFTVGFGASTSGVNWDDNSAFADFVSTLTLSKIEVFNGSGNPITGWTTKSASGTFYGPDGVTAPPPPPPPPAGATVPEPGTWILLGTALAGLATALRARTRRSR